MIKTLVCLMLAGVFQSPVDAFKREMTPLQTDVDKLVNDTQARVMGSSKAALIEGYGVVATVSVALEPPRGLFGASLTKDEVIKNVNKRQKDIKDRLTAMMKQRVVSLESVGAEDSLAIVVHLENYNSDAVPNLPHQLVFTVKKASPQMVNYKEI